MRLPRGILAFVASSVAVAPGLSAIALSRRICSSGDSRLAGLGVFGAGGQHDRDDDLPPFDIYDVGTGQFLDAEELRFEMESAEFALPAELDEAARLHGKR